MIVMKFGGTSVGSAERIKEVSKIVKSHIGRKPIVVVSAVTKITDALINLAQEVEKGKGNLNLENIKNTHYEIIKKLQLYENLLDGDIENLSLLVERHKNKKIDAKSLDEFKSFGEKMSSKIFAAQLTKIGIKAQAINAWDTGFLTDSEFGNAEILEKSYTKIKVLVNSKDLQV